jgi:uncharacterized protein (DUF1499 family)
MSAPLSALFHRGAGGLPPAEPVDFATLTLPASPNTCLATPAGGNPAAHLATPLLPVEPHAAWPALLALGGQFPRTTLLANWPDRLQAQWVERSGLMNYPDIIAAELRPAAGGATLWLYSWSLFGWSDLGVNRKRVDAWIAALSASLRAG